MFSAKVRIVFIRSMMTLGLLLNMMVASGSATPGTVYSVADSVRILDSLVNMKKVADNNESIRLARMAFRIAKRHENPEFMVAACKMMGIAYFQHQKDSSYFYYNRALKLAQEAGLEEPLIIILYNLAWLHVVSNYYTRAVSLLDSSIRLARVYNDFKGLSNATNMLGMIKINTHEYESAKQHFMAALEIAREHNFYDLMGVALGNLARSQFEPDPEKSMALQRQALQYLKMARGMEEEMANILINIGNRFTIPDSAISYYRAAIEIGESASLPIIIMGAYNNMAYSYLDKGDIAGAESCVRDHAIPMALNGEYHDWLSSLYDTYADVYEAKGDLKNALAIQKKALKERVADYRQKATDQVRLISAQLDLQNMELAVQNEEKKVLMQRNQLQKTELGLAVTAMLVILSVFTLIYLQHRNKVKFQQEKISSARRIIEMEESEKGRTARELHDLTGQLVLGISGMIENLDFPEPETKQQITDSIKDLGKSIRQISHRMNRAMLEHFTFPEMVTGLCRDYQKLVGLNIRLTIPEELPELPNELVLHFYRILQELLTNAGKYAREGEIGIDISLQNEGLSLGYIDHGPGFPEGAEEKKGMGLQNIFERVKLVNGKAEVFSTPGVGTRWELLFPLQVVKTKDKAV